MSVAVSPTSTISLGFDKDSIEAVFQNIVNLHKIPIYRNDKYFDLMIDVLNYLDGNYDASMNNPADCYARKYHIIDHRAKRLIHRTISEYRKIRPTTELSLELERTLLERAEILYRSKVTCLQYDPLLPL